MRILATTIGVVCLVIGFFAGKFTQGASTQTTANTTQQYVNAETKNSLNNTPITEPATASSENTVRPTKDCSPVIVTSTKENAHITTQPTKPIGVDGINTSNKPALKFTTTIELSDESVDELVPKPFNNAIKSMHGQFKEKYAEFLANETKNEWA